MVYLQVNTTALGLRPSWIFKMFFHRAPLAFIVFFLVAAVLFFCFLAYFYLWMCCRKRYRLKEQKKQATAEKKANEERFHDLAKPEGNEDTTKGNTFYPIVFHNKKLETAELRLLWKSNIISLVFITSLPFSFATNSNRGKLLRQNVVCTLWSLARISFWHTFM